MSRIALGSFKWPPRVRAHFKRYHGREWAMIRPGGRGQWFVLAMFQRPKMRQPEQYARLTTRKIDTSVSWILVLIQPKIPLLNHAERLHLIHDIFLRFREPFRRKNHVLDYLPVTTPIPNHTSPMCLACDSISTPEAANVPAAITTGLIPNFEVRYATTGAAKAKVLHCIRRIILIIVLIYAHFDA